MARRLRSSPAPAVRPTYTRILEHAVAVLNEDGFDRFSVQRVLDSADVSRATLYRHFLDVDALIEAALVEQFGQEVDRTLAVATELIEGSVDPDTFRKGVRALLENLSNVPANVRQRRSHTIALAATRPELATAIAAVQEQLTDGWDTMLQAAQRRGLLRADIDTRAVAVMTQAITIGRIIDDAATSHLTNERWADTFFQFIEQAVLAPAPAPAKRSR